MYKTYISPNWIAPININLKSKLNFLKLYIVIVEKKISAIRFLMKLIKAESIPGRLYLIIPKENDQRIDTKTRYITQTLKSSISFASL